MAVKIRLSRGGSKKAPFYNIVVSNSRSPRDGKFIEKLGYYNPLVTKEKETELNKKYNIALERVTHWLSVGAEPSFAVAKIFVSLGVTEAQKFIKPVVKNEFFGMKREEKKKILNEREEARQKALKEAQKKKASA